MKTTAVSPGLGFPHARTAIQVTRRRRALNGTRWRTETVYAITDLDQTQIRPDEIADTLRGHWFVENRLHWVRDVTLGEDLSQIRTCHGPAVMAATQPVNQRAPATAPPTSPPQHDAYLDIPAVYCPCCYKPRSTHVR